MQAFHRVHVSLDGSSLSYLIIKGHVLPLPYWTSILVPSQQRWDYLSGNGSSSKQEVCVSLSCFYEGLPASARRLHVRHPWNSYFSTLPLSPVALPYRVIPRGTSIGLKQEADWWSWLSTCPCQAVATAPFSGFPTRAASGGFGL